MIIAKERSINIKDFVVSASEKKEHLDMTGELTNEQWKKVIDTVDQTSWNHIYYLDNSRWLKIVNPAAFDKLPKRLGVLNNAVKFLSHDIEKMNSETISAWQIWENIEAGAAMKAAYPEWFSLLPAVRNPEKLLKIMQKPDPDFEWHAHMKDFIILFPHMKDHLSKTDLLEVTKKKMDSFKFIEWGDYWSRAGTLKLIYPDVAKDVIDAEIPASNGSNSVDDKNILRNLMVRLSHKKLALAQTIELTDEKFIVDPAPNPAITLPVRRRF
jgi:hypothetical protein